MENLTLNQKTYLCEKLKPIYPFEDFWGLAEVITPAQRTKLLALYYRHDYNEVKEVLENIKNFQYLTKKQ